MSLRFNVQLLAGALFAVSAIASPTPIEFEAVTKVLVPRQTTTAAASAISNSAQLSSALSGFTADFSSLAAAVSAGEAIFTNIVPAPGPTAISQLESELAIINSANVGDIWASGAEILLNGLAGGDYVQIANAYLVESNTNNLNPIQPAQPVYPKAAPGDAPYSVSEQQLRQVIYIPPAFTYGKIQPVIFVPGTGTVGGQNFGPNFGKLFAQNRLVDPVYLNIPGNQLADIQVDSEFVAYAINYISGISSGKNVSLISWSQGSVNGQWAMKYWPSTRKHVSDAIRISPDYHGSIEAQLLCPGVVAPGCDPAIAQQNYNSTFIATLRNNGGDSAYVPTTDVYSIFDEIVEPQQNPNASGFLNDARGVGVTNVELQSVCTALLPGGAIYNDHEGVLYNALAYALTVDALTHPGPGQLSRINITFQCEQFATPGLSLADIFATEALIPLGLFNTLAYKPKVAQEPPIMPYARGDTPS